MCYVVAKNANKIGSVAIRMKLGKPVVQLKAEMNSRYLNKGIQFVTISRPSAYGEYAPLPLRGHDSGVQGGSREAVISHKAVITHKRAAHKSSPTCAPRFSILLTFP